MQTDPEEVEFGMDISPYRGRNGASWPISIIAGPVLLFHVVILVSALVIMCVCPNDAGATASGATG